jgi:head-tail adaptor
MSYPALLTQRCTIEDYASTPDDYGQPTKTWADTATLVPCLLEPTKGVEFELGKQVVVANYTLFLLANQTISERSRVVLDSVTYEVLLVKRVRTPRSEHHRECYVEVAR